MSNTIISCSSLTDKSTGNQDYCCEVTNMNAGFNGVIVADGIGSHKMSELSSKFCSEELKSILERINVDSEIDFKLIFTLVKSGLIKYSETINTAAYDIPLLQLGTTLICVLSFEEHYLIAYAGNGSVWHTAAGFDEFSTSIYVPWNSINLLNPQSVEVKGKAGLVNYISVTDASEIPVVLKVSKDNDGRGEIIILTTDGIFSNDNIATGKDEESRIWLLMEKNMTSLYGALSDFLKIDPVGKSKEGLKAKLEEYLAGLKENNAMHDDSTLGIIISSRAAMYYQDKWERQNNSGDEADKTH
jgi:PPM family protein phosphatase